MFGFNCQTAQGMFTHASSWRRPGPIATGVRGYAELGLPPFFSNRQRWKWVPGQARDDSGFCFSDSTVKQREDVSRRSRGVRRPSFANFPPPPSSTEGAGKAGCALHPRSRAQIVQGNAHTSIQVKRRQSGFPCAMGYGLLRALPGDRLSCHRHQADNFRKT
jgi:hypothetical protein